MDSSITILISRAVVVAQLAERVRIQPSATFIERLFNDVNEEIKK